MVQVPIICATMAAPDRLPAPGAGGRDGRPSPSLDRTDRGNAGARARHLHAIDQCLGGTAPTRPGSALVRRYEPRATESTRLGGRHVADQPAGLPPPDGRSAT